MTVPIAASPDSAFGWPLYLFDTDLVEYVTEAVPTELAVILVGLSYLGSIWFIGPTVILAYWVSERRRAVSWLLIMVGCYALLALVKAVFDVPRPSVDPPVGPAVFPTILEPVYHTAVSLDSESFPSGHALAATVFYGLLAVDLRISTQRRRIAAAAGLVVGVSLIRLLLATHYLADLVTGITLGIVYLSTVLYVRRRVAAPQLALVLLAMGIGGLALYGDRGHEAIDLLAATVGGVLGLHLTARRPPVTPDRRWPYYLATVIVAGVIAGGLIIHPPSVTVSIPTAFVLGAVVTGLPILLSGARTGIARIR